MQIKNKLGDIEKLQFTPQKKTLFTKQNRLEDFESLCCVEVITLKGDVPSPRNDHRNILRDKKLYLFGGTTDKGSPFMAFVLDLQSNIWKQTKFLDKFDQKKPVSGMGIMVWPQKKYPHLKGYALMYGGWTGKEYSDNLFMINLLTMEIRTLKKQHQYTLHDIKEFRMKQAVSIGNSKQIQKYQTSQYPPARKDLTLTYISSENKVCLYGGWEGDFNTGSKQQLWVLSNTWKWEKYYGVNRRGHTSVVIDDKQRGNGFLVFGGFKGIKVVSNESMFFDLKNKKWHNIQLKEDELLPCGRAYHTANLIHNKMIIIGGLDDQYKILEDIWIFDIDKGSWSRILLPMKHRHLTRRAGHSSFVIDKTVYVVGGMTFYSDKKQYARLPLNQMVSLDFSRLFEKEVIKEEKQELDSKNVIPHNVEHHWDIGEFGFVIPKKQELQDIFSDLQRVGITDIQN